MFGQCGPSDLTGLIRPYPPLLESRSGSRGVSRGSRGYFGSPGGYGYYHLKGLEKRERFIYPIPNFHGILRDMTISDFGFRSTFNEGSVRPYTALKAFGNPFKGL